MTIICCKDCFLSMSAVRFSTTLKIPTCIIDVCIMYIWRRLLPIDLSKWLVERIATGSIREKKNFWLYSAGWDFWCNGLRDRDVWYAPLRVYQENSTEYKSMIFFEIRNCNVKRESFFFYLFLLFKKMNE